MKRILLGLGSVLVLLIGGALVAPSFIDWSKYKQPAIDAAHAATGYDISVDGSIGLSILPRPSVKIENVTVRLPGQTGDQHIVSLERLNVAVALFPLLSGKIEVADVQLVKPDIRLTYGPNGEPEWATDKVKAMMGMKNAVDAAAPLTDAPANAPATPMAVTINDFAIRDGHVVLNDKKSKATYDVSQINSNLSLASLKGPFDFDGSAVYRDVPLKISGNIGELGTPDMPVKVTLKSPDFGTEITYNGAVSLSPVLNVQGQVDVSSKHLIPMLSAFTGQKITAPDQPLTLKGLATATLQNVVLDNMVFGYGDLALAGSVKTRLPEGAGEKPFVQARLSSKDTLQVSKLMASMAPTMVKPEKGKGTGTATSATNPAAAVSAIKLPVDLDATITAPGVVIARDEFKDVTVSVNAKGDDLKARVIAGQIPGNGKLDVTLYPGEGANLTASVALNVVDAVKLVRDGLGVAIPAGVPVDKFRDLTLKTDMALAGRNISAKTGTIKWSGGELSFAGSGYKTQSNGRPLTLITLGGGALNLDELLGLKPSTKSTAPAAPGAAKETIVVSTKNINVPMDIDFSISLGALTTGGQTFKGLVAAGTLKKDALTIGMFEVGDYQGVAATAKGSVASLKNLTGIDMKVSVRSANVTAALKKFGITPPDLGRDPGAGALDLSYKGTIEAANVNADVTLWGVRVGGAGPVRDPFGTPAIDNLKLNVAANNAADMFKIVQPNFKATQPLQGPLKLTADATISGKKYTLKNVVGTVGSMLAKGDIVADLSGKPSISGGLTLGDVPLDALMGVDRTTAAAASTNSVPAASTGGGKWSTAPLNTDWMRMLNLDFTIVAKSLTYNLWILNSPTLAFAVQDGTLSVKDAQAGLFGGKIKGGGSMAAKSSGAPVAMNWNGDMSGVNARSLTNAFMNKNMNKIDGTVGMTFKVTSNGASPAVIIGALNGQAASSGKDVTVNGIDVAKLVTWLTTDLKPSTTLAGIQDSFFGTGATTFAEHNGSYTITNGIINLDQMLFDGAQASLNTTGSVSLPAWTINTNSSLQVKNPPNIPAVKFALNGYLSNPGSTMGRGMFENYLQQKLQDRAGKLLEKKLGGKLQDLGLGGLFGGHQPDVAPPDVEPTAPQDPAPVAPAPEEKMKPEDVLIDVLKGLGR